MRRVDFGLVEAGVVVLVAVLCIGFQLTLPGRLSTEADEQAAAKAIEAEWKPGDVALLFPWWTERLRVAMPASIPVVGYQGSDADDLELAPRVWVISQPGLPKADEKKFLAAFGPKRTAVGAVKKFGPLEVTLYENGRFRQPVFSGFDALASARVSVESSQGRADCSWNGQFHQCPNGSQVAAEWHEVKFQPRRCLRMHPPGGDARLVVEFSGLPDARAFAVRTGYTWDRGYFHNPGLTATVVELDVNGAKAPSVTLPPGLEGVQKTEIAAAGAGATVRISTQSANPEYRDVCVELYGFGTAP